MKQKGTEQMNTRDAKKRKQISLFTENVTGKIEIVKVANISRTISELRPRYRNIVCDLSV